MSSATAIQWLLTSLRKPLADQKNKLLPPPPDMDWDEFIEYASQHSISPFLYSQLQSDVEVWSALPSFIQEELTERYRYSAHRNLQMYFQFLKMMKKLENVPVILLKGGFLAYVVYGDRALRPMADIDILVKRSDIASVESALMEMGYRLSDWQHRDWCLKNHYHLSYLNTDLEVHFEIHWDLQRTDARYPIDIDELWRDAQPVTIAGVEVMTLSLSHLILYHCLHIAKHTFEMGLRHFCDLAAILAHYQGQIDWRQLQGGAEQWHISKAVYLSFYFTYEFFGDVAETAMHAFISVAPDQAVIDAARVQILTAGHSAGNNASRLSSGFLELLEGNSEQNKVPHLLKRIFLPRDLMASVYRLSPNSWRIYLYYPVRLFHLLSRYPQITLKFMRRDQGMLSWAEETSRAEMLRKWLVT